MLLVFVLAPLLESNMRKAFIISNGKLDIFFDKPISAFLLLVLLVIVLTPVVKFILKKAGVLKK